MEAVNGDRMKAACDSIFAKGIRGISNDIREETGRKRDREVTDRTEETDASGVRRRESASNFLPLIRSSRCVPR